MAARSGRLAVKVDGPNLYIYKGGLFYKLKTEDLEIVKSLVLEETPEQKRSERAPKAPAPEGVEKKPPTKEGEKQ
jgi:(2Fe-2S) ferredoxin